MVVRAGPRHGRRSCRCTTPPAASRRSSGPGPVGPVDLGGPEILTWTDVARIYERVLGRRVRVVSQPVAAFAVAQRLCTPVAPSLAGVMALNRLMGSSQTGWDTAHAARQLGLDAMRTVEEILREKAALPPIR
jgi:uncharacterized protein YbjT (DUF2867 family)